MSARSVTRQSKRTLVFFDADKTTCILSTRKVKNILDANQRAARRPDAGKTQLRALTDAGETRFARVLDAVFDKLFLGSTVRLQEVPFIGHLLTPQGLIADSAKVEAIVNMPEPTDVKSLRRALGMINYLSKFLLNLSSCSDVLRQLSRKNVKWHWDDKHGKAWNELMAMISQVPVLAFFDLEKEVTIQCDASQSGLGTVLMQEDKPVHYISRAMISAEKNYAQVEKEPLAIIFACERFDQYVYGRSVIIESDHKPLEQIWSKPFHEIPKITAHVFTVAKVRCQNYLQKGLSVSSCRYPLPCVPYQRASGL